jgi:hypothetical protein
MLSWGVILLVSCIWDGWLLRVNTQHVAFQSQFSTYSRIIKQMFVAFKQIGLKMVKMPKAVMQNVTGSLVNGNSSE